MKIALEYFMMKYSFFSGSKLWNTILIIFVSPKLNILFRIMLLWFASFLNAGRHFTTEKHEDFIDQLHSTKLRIFLQKNSTNGKEWNGFKDEKMKVRSVEMILKYKGKVLIFNVRDIHETLLV